MKSETLLRTTNKQIFVEQQKTIDPACIMDDLQRLDRAVTEQMPAEELVSTLRGMIPTYHAPEEVNKRAEKALEASKKEESSAP